MVNKYDVLEKLITLVGHLGHAMVYISMISACILVWYYIFKLI